MASTGWAILVAVSASLLPACSSSSPTPASTTLDGVYQATGAYSWTAFHEGQYSLWSSSEACSGSHPALATCLQSGSFALDADTHVLTLTDAATGAVWTAALSELEAQPLALSTQTVAIRALTDSPGPIAGGPSSLTGTSGSLASGSGALISGYSAQPLSGSGSGVQLANWRATIYLLCQLMTGGTDPLPDKPAPVPVPITQTCGGPKK